MTNYIHLMKIPIKEQKKKLKIHILFFEHTLLCTNKMNSVQQAMPNLKRYRC